MFRTKAFFQFLENNAIVNSTSFVQDTTAEEPNVLGMQLSELETRIRRKSPLHEFDTNSIPNAKEIWKALFGILSDFSNNGIDRKTFVLKSKDVISARLQNIKQEDRYFVAAGISELYESESGKILGGNRSKMQDVRRIVLHLRRLSQNFAKTLVVGASGIVGLGLAGYYGGRLINRMISRDKKRW